MYAIFTKEINAFFSSLVGYIAVGVFLVAMSGFLWFFPETNLLDYGYSTLDQLFAIAPNIFLFLIPAITMRAFAEETQTGTIELLATRPLTDLNIILGKYFACIILIITALTPTLIYYITIYQLGDPVGNIDTGAVIGSYLGLLLLGSAFAAIGIFASSLTNNQIVSFVLALFLCFATHIGFEFIKDLPIFSEAISGVVEMLGMNYHYNSLSRGLIDSRDVIYFLSIITFFIVLTRFQLEKRTW